MSGIASLAADLRDTSAQIARIEQQIVQYPNENSLLFNLRSLQKRMRKLEEQFTELSEAASVDVVDFKIIAGTLGLYPVYAIGSALTTFQQMFTVFFDALKSGPKTRARIAADVWEATRLDFAYSFDGSVGFAMTMPSKRDLFGSPYDAAIERAFEVIGAKEIADLAMLAKIVGIAAIRGAYAWIAALSNAEMGAEIKWKHGRQIINSTSADAEHLRKLKELIEKTSDTESETISITGQLEGIDHAYRTFHIQPLEGEGIKGKLADSFTFDESVKIPRPVVAKVLKQKKIYYSTEKEEISWELKSYE